MKIDKDKIIKCDKCKKLISKSAISCVWCGFSMEAQEYEEEDPIYQLFWHFMWNQLNKELEEKYKINLKEWEWLGDCQDDHWCPIAKFVDVWGYLINLQCCHHYYTRLDWECNNTCRQLVPEGMKLYDEEALNYYKPEPQRCRVRFYWVLIEPHEVEGMKCKHDLNSLPQLKRIKKMVK